MPAASDSARLRAALARGATALWQADQLAGSALPACTSGFAELDAELPGGGWPAAGLTELLLHAAGCGEIRLLAPALARFAADGRELVWVAPPFPPYAPALHALGVPPANLLWLQSQNEADAAWAAEQVLRTGAAGAVLWWSGARALPATLRRLHLAAQSGTTPLFALRPAECRRQSSPAPLRIELEPAAGALLVHLLKRRGPSLAAPLKLVLPQPARERPAPASIQIDSDAVVRPAPALAAARVAAG